MRNALFSAILLLAAAGGAGADTIFFKNGARLDIGTTWVHDGKVKCLLYGEVVGYPLGEVLRVEKDAPPDNDTPSVKPRNPADIRRNLEVMTLHNRAVELARAGKTQEALRVEKQAHALSPDNDVVRATLGSLHNGLAVEKKNLGDLEGALAQLTTALNYAPQEPQLQKNLAVVYVDMARQAAAKNDIRQARTLLDGAMEHDRQNPHCHALSGQIAYLENDYDRAEQEWSRALKLAPQLAEVRERLERLGREKSLEKDFETRTGDHFSIKFESAHNRELADSIMAVLRGAYRDVGRDFERYPDWPVPVIVYSQAELGQLDYFPDWASGAYDGKIRFAETIQKRNLHMKAVLYHEYTHVLVRMAAGAAAPFWLNEGLAEYEARPFKTPGMLRSRERLLHRTRRLFTLQELAAMNVAALSRLPGTTVELVYAQSESFVKWLVDKYGMRPVRSLLALLGGGDGIETAVRSAFNEELATLERQWHGCFAGAGPP